MANCDSGYLEFHSYRYPEWRPASPDITVNLSYEIEHHLYPDLPSHRLAEIGVRVCQLCEK